MQHGIDTALGTVASTLFGSSMSATAAYILLGSAVALNPVVLGLGALAGLTGYLAIKD